MIRIKTFSFRQAIERMFFYIMIFFVLFLIIIFSILIAYFLKEELKAKIFRKSTYSEQVFSKSMFIKSILDDELSFLSFENNKESENENNNLIYDDFESNNINDIYEIPDDNSLIVELKELPKIEYKIPEKFETEILDNGKIKVGNTKITNYSKLELDLDTLSKPSQIKLDSNTDFLIFHTHATESYTVDSEDVVNYRTTNQNYNMLSIGECLVDELEMRGFNTLHDTILHDYPSYNGAYKHSLETVSKYLKSKNFDFVVDIHRDAISSDLTYGPVCKIGEEKAAELMFVIGTDASGLEHKNWMDNLKLAIMIQNRANEMYPRFI
ncbi:MAG: stage II sporulation protein P [Clostridia bacterium]|nr:stage II sporulation protein P [Clostridia bacterium]